MTWIQIAAGQGPPLDHGPPGFSLQRLQEQSTTWGSPATEGIATLAHDIKGLLYAFRGWDEHSMNRPLSGIARRDQITERMV